METQSNVLYKECMVEYEKEMEKECKNADVFLEDEKLEQKHSIAREKVISQVRISSFFLKDFNF